MRPRVCLFSVCFAVTLGTGCRNSQAPTAEVGATVASSLSRDQAREVIQNSGTFATTTVIQLGQPAETVGVGVREGLWDEKGFGGLVPTPGGRQYFLSFDGFPQYQGHLAVPAKRGVVEITGITDNGSGQVGKLVLFTWRYVDLPEVVARYTCQGDQPHEGKAILRLYDDGWRVEDSELLETGRIEFAGVSAGVVIRENEAALRKQEADRIARVPSRTIGSYRFVLQGRNPNGPYQATYLLEITDVGVRCSGNRTAWGSNEVWFGDIRQVALDKTVIDGRGPAVPRMRVWHKKAFVLINGSLYNDPLILIEQNTGDLNDLPNAYKVLMDAVADWQRWYNAMLSGEAPLAPRSGEAGTTSLTTAQTTERFVNNGDAVALEAEYTLMKQRRSELFDAYTMAINRPDEKPLGQQLLAHLIKMGQNRRRAAALGSRTAANEAAELDKQIQRIQTKLR